MTSVSVIFFAVYDNKHIRLSIYAYVCVCTNICVSRQNLKRNAFPKASTAEKNKIVRTTRSYSRYQLVEPVRSGTLRRFSQTISVKKSMEKT